MKNGQLKDKLLKFIGIFISLFFIVFLASCYIVSNDSIELTHEVLLILAIECSWRSFLFSFAIWMMYAVGVIFRKRI